MRLLKIKNKLKIGFIEGEPYIAIYSHTQQCTAVFGLSTLISYRDIFRQCYVITRGKTSHSGY